MGDEVGAGVVVAVGRVPHRLRSCLRGPGLRQQARVCRARAPPADNALHRGADEPPRASARAVDRRPGAAAGGPGLLGPGAGADGAQRQAVVQAEQEDRLPAALPAEVRQLRPRDPRLRLPRLRQATALALLPVLGQGSAHPCTGDEVPAGLHRCRRARSGRLGPRRGPARRPRTVAGAVRTLRRRGQCRRERAPLGAGPDPAADRAYRTRRQPLGRGLPDGGDQPLGACRTA
jgi:hypothetical protein